MVLGMALATPPRRHAVVPAGRSALMVVEPLGAELCHKRQAGPWRTFQPQVCHMPATIQRLTSISNLCCPVRGRLAARQHCSLEVVLPAAWTPGRALRERLDGIHAVRDSGRRPIHQACRDGSVGKALRSQCQGHGFIPRFHSTDLAVRACGLGPQGRPGDRRSEFRRPEEIAGTGQAMPAIPAALAENAMSRISVPVMAAWPSVRRWDRTLMSVAVAQTCKPHTRPKRQDVLIRACKIQ